MEQTTVLASFGKRLGGALIDTLILAVVMIFIILLVVAIPGDSESNQISIRPDRTTGTILQVIFLAVSFGVFVLLQSYLLYTKGQTIGKVIVKTKIVDMQGNLPDFGNLLSLRYLVWSVLTLVPILGSFIGLIDILFVFREDRRCLHDLLAGTQVVEA